MGKSNFVERLLQLILTFVIAPVFVMLAHILISATFGWFIGLFFGNTILGILAQIGITGYSMWQIGVFFGFISGFFRSMITFNSKRKA